MGERFGPALRLTPASLPKRSLSLGRGSRGKDRQNHGGQNHLGCGPAILRGESTVRFGASLADFASRILDFRFSSRRLFLAPRQTLPAVALSLSLLVSPTVLWADSLWSDSTRPMFADKRGTSVGDILTIIVQENNSTSKDNNTKTSKTSGVDASISSFLYSPAASGLLTKGGTMPALKFDSKNAFDGGGAIKNSENIIARIAVRVIDVLPNRNLVIEGSRDTAFSGEAQTIVLRGVVRPEDIAANNTIYSYNVADSTIRFVSKGTLTDSQKKGWVNKIWDKISPF